ncbi:hypothetical protein CBR_g3677 [Chara braunii]|uniref:non-specific serine/threonine protein kinase n=1 Tax=Chara braunii TaxID=69332 RepID=A0A388KG38_CHABU|nr:hypothetical protein CBR_g3677 [Chara braunii]|eukprot:GBG68978.1 hypothetical protein CBR_g3677 [Chara braunii]
MRTSASSMIPRGVATTMTWGGWRRGTYRRWRLCQTRSLSVFRILFAFLLIEFVLYETGPLSDRGVYAADEQLVSLRINCGSSNPVTWKGVGWGADRFFLGGVSMVGNVPLLSHSHPLSSYREFSADDDPDNFYKVPVRPGKYYVVRLWFATLWQDPLLFNVILGDVIAGSVELGGARETVSLVNPPAAGISDEVVEEYRLFAAEPFLRIGVKTSTELNRRGRINAIEILPMLDDHILLFQQGGEIGRDVILRTEARVNCGSVVDDNDSKHGGSESEWDLDDGYFKAVDGSSVISCAGLPVSGMNRSGWLKSEVLKTARASTSNLLYTLPVRPALQYYIQLHFGHILSSETGEQEHVFDVHVDGSLHRKGVHPVSEPVVYIVRPELSSKGNISIELQPVKGAAFISGIEVYGEIPTMGRTASADVAAFVELQKAFADALRGDSLQQRDPCISPSAPGFICSYEPRRRPRILGINFTGSWLFGSIPPAIGQLHNAEQIFLGSNGFKGVIPMELEALKAARVIDLSNNLLSGSIPAWLARLPALEILRLDSNNFTGEVPSVLIKKLGSNFTCAGNPQLCESPPCEGQRSDRQKPGASANEANDANNKVAAEAKSPTEHSKLQQPVQEHGWISSRRRLLENGMGAGAAVGVKHGPNVAIALVVSVIASVGALAFSMVLCFFFKKGRSPGKNPGGATPPSGVSNVEKPMMSPALPKPVELHGPVRRFDYKEIKKLTAGFSDPIGRGSFGYVYRGQLPESSSEVAVKVRSDVIGEFSAEFQKEVEVLSGVRHKNLVKLIGYCTEKVQAILLEYLPNGSLYEYLHGKRKGQHLSWSKRLQIAQGAAYGIEYLHTQVRPMIIHRDVKSANILLDDKFEAKVTDFGYARVVMDDVTHVMTITEVQGSTGYLDPEYYNLSLLSEKSDVYSFGVVLLEILTGREPIFPAESGGKVALPDWARPFLNDRDIDFVVDPRLNAEHLDLNSLWEVADCAMLCCEPHGCNRPRIGDVARCLERASEFHVEALRASQQRGR